MPPASWPAELPENVELDTDSLPEFKMPPPDCVAELLANLELFTVRLPLLKTAPPMLPAELPEKASFVRVSVPVALPPEMVIWLAPSIVVRPLPDMSSRGPCFSVIVWPLRLEANWIIGEIPRPRAFSALARAT